MDVDDYNNLLKIITVTNACASALSESLCLGLAEQLIDKRLKLYLFKEYFDHFFSMSKH